MHVLRWGPKVPPPTHIFCHTRMNGMCVQRTAYPVGCVEFRDYCILYVHLVWASDPQCASPSDIPSPNSSSTRLLIPYPYLRGSYNRVPSRPVHPSIHPSIQLYAHAHLILRLRPTSAHTCRTCGSLTYIHIYIGTIAPSTHPSPIPYVPCKPTFATAHPKQSAYRGNPSRSLPPATQRTRY